MKYFTNLVSIQNELKQLEKMMVSTILQLKYSTSKSFLTYPTLHQHQL